VVKIAAGVVIAAALVLIGVAIGEHRAASRIAHDVVAARPPGPPPPQNDVATGQQLPPRMPAAPMPALQVEPPSGGQRSADELAREARDADPHVRRDAIAEMAKSANPDPKALLAASHDPDLDVALAATTGVGELYLVGQVSAKDLIALAKDTRSPEKVRVAALNGLGGVASRDSATALVDLLAHGPVEARRSAAILLARQVANLAVPALISALGDADQLVRENAHESLRAFGHGRDFGMDAAAWTTWFTASQPH
jgi:HEAT repeat protein